MDHNANILRVIGHLRDLSATWRGGYELCCSLLASLECIIDTINRSNDALYSISSFRERKWQEYVDGMRYNEIKNLKITKNKIYSQFRLHGIDNILETTRTHIYIKWCVSKPIRDHLMDRWYMFFYDSHTTTGKYHCNSFTKFMQSLCWEKMSTILTCWGSRALVGGCHKIVPILRIWMQIDI